MSGGGGAVVDRTWLTTGDVLERWPESLGMDEGFLGEVVQAAKEQCAAYVGTSHYGRESYTSLRLAHLLQIQSLYKAHVAGTGDTIGADGFAVRVYPMDRTVKALLRPKRGVPVVG